MSSVKVRAALEVALNGMAGIIPAVTISSSSVAAATVITTASAHGLTSGVSVTIAAHSGSTPSINSSYIITVTGASTFTIPVAVTIAGTGGTVKANLIAWRGVPFTPIAGVPYQECAILFARPDNSEFGPRYFEQGYMQVKLKYPALAYPGTAASGARAEALRTTFKRGTSFTSGGVTTTIQTTPSIEDGEDDGDRLVTIAKIRFKAEITA